MLTIITGACLITNVTILVRGEERHIYAGETQKKEQDKMVKTRGKILFSFWKLLQVDFSASF